MSIRAEKKAISVVKKSVLNGIHALDLVFSEGILQLVCRGGVSGRGLGESQGPQSEPPRPAPRPPPAEAPPADSTLS